MDLFFNQSGAAEENFLKIAVDIALGNRKLFGDIKSVTPMRPGFANLVFSVNDRYVIKICREPEKENLFDTEVLFYEKNGGSKNIPEFYRYDKSKKLVPRIYEIIEKIDGKSVYYHWYKMSEGQRENFIRELVNVIKDIHREKRRGYDWAGFVKSGVLENLDKTEDMFSRRERELILASLEKYDEILRENSFCLIHNDLHFDNILIDGDGTIKLIDFCDMMTAPFDFDLRLLYMGTRYPKKWANAETEDFRVPEDYKNLFDYIKKYYKELKNVKYLEQRQKAYRVLYDFGLLRRFKDPGDKEKILENSQRILKSF